MLVTKKKHDLLIKNYNELVDDRDTWKTKCGVLNIRLDQLKEVNTNLQKVIDNQDDEIVHLKFKCVTFKEKYTEWFQRFIKTKEELDIVDRIVLQYEQRINELEEQLNETTI